MKWSEITKIIAGFYVLGALIGLIVVGGKWNQAHGTISTPIGNSLVALGAVLLASLGIGFLVLFFAFVVDWSGRGLWNAYAIRAYRLGWLGTTALTLAPLEISFWTAPLFQVLAGLVAGLIWVTGLLPVCLYIGSTSPRVRRLQRENRAIDARIRRLES